MNERFINKINRINGCWIWTAGISAGGYGVFWNGKKQVYAHRYSYEFYKGEIPQGLEIDHLCRNRNCVNPKHLEAVTRSVNTKRGLIPKILRERQKTKTHCPKGHEYNYKNTYHRPGKPEDRDCRICRREARRRSTGYYVGKEVL